MALKGASSAASRMEDDRESGLVGNQRRTEVQAGRGEGDEAAGRLLVCFIEAQHRRSLPRVPGTMAVYPPRHAGTACSKRRVRLLPARLTLLCRDVRPIRIGWCRWPPVRQVNLDWEGVSVASSPSGETGCFYMMTPWRIFCREMNA